MMYCSNCGSYCAGGRFCARCGAPTNGGVDWYNTRSAPRQQHIPQQTYSPQAYPRQAYNQQPYYPSVPRPVQPYYPKAQPLPDTPEKQMKRAFNRGGLGVISMYGSFTVLGTAFLYIAVMIAFFSSGYSLYGLSPDNMWAAIYDLLYSEGALQSTSALFVVLSYVIGMVLGMIIGIWLLKKIMRRANPAAPEARGLTGGEFLLALMFAFGAWGVGVAIGNLPAIIFPVESAVDMLYDALGVNMLPFFAYTVIGAPILEELAFRKALCGGLSKYGKAPAVIASALLFGLMHQNSGQFFLAFFVGLVFGCVYLYSGRIIYTILLHGIINLIGTLPQLFALGGTDITLGWEIAIAVLGLAGVIFIIIFRRHPMLRPAPAPIPNSRKAVFANVGMRIAVIGGLALTMLADLSPLLLGIYNGFDGYDIMRLFISSVTVALVILTITCTCRGKAPTVIPPTE